MSGSSVTDVLYISGIMLFLGMLLVFANAGRFILMQRIRNTPPSKIRSAAMGLVEFLGVPERPDGMRSPVSGHPCIYWRVVASDLCDIESSTPFMLKDGTGAIPVDASRANIDGLRHKEYSFCLADPEDDWEMDGEKPEGIKRFIEGLDPELKAKFRKHKDSGMDLAESWLAPSKSLYVLGNAEPSGGKPSPEGYRNLVVRGKGRMFISPFRESTILRETSRNVAVAMAVGLVLIGISSFLIISGIAAY